MCPDEHARRTIVHRVRFPPHESAFSPVLYPVHFLFMFKESADNEHERTSFSSQRRKRDRAYATTIIEAHRNVRTYRHIIAEKKNTFPRVRKFLNCANFCCFMRNRREGGTFR